MQRILIAGATGYLGKFLITECKQRGHWVRALVRDANRLGPAKASVDDVFVGQATDPATLRGLCDDIDIVISALGVASSRRKETIPLDDVDYGGNHNILALGLEIDSPHTSQLPGILGLWPRRNFCWVDAKGIVNDLRLRQVEAEIRFHEVSILFGDEEASSGARKCRAMRIPSLTTQKHVGAGGLNQQAVRDAQISTKLCHR